MPPMEIERKFLVDLSDQSSAGKSGQLSVPPHRAGLFKHRPRPAHPQTG